MVACMHDEFPRPPDDEHPIIAIVAVIAIVGAILLITWARFEVHGTGDIESALTEEGPSPAVPEHHRQLDEAVTSNRFAGGVSPQ
jgi:hypothetical protein